MVHVVPLRPVLLVQLLPLHPRHRRLAVHLHQPVQRIVALLRVLLVAVHLKLDNHVLLQQKVLQILESHALGKSLPARQSVLVLPVADGVLQLLVVFSGLSQHFERYLRLALSVLPASGLVQH